MNRAWKVLSLALVAGMGLALYQTASAEDPTLQELDQKIKVLERKLEISEESAATKAKEAPALTAGKEGFALSSADKSFQLRLRGYAQGDGRFFLDDSEDKASDTFLVRRARVIFDGTLGKLFEFRIAPDFGNGKSELQDGYIDFKPSALANLRFGRTKAPIGLERLQSSADTIFNEVSLATGLTPNYDEGVLLQGSLSTGVVDYALGYFNGAPDGASVDSDNGDGKDVVGRVWVTPLKYSEVAALSGLSLGIGGSVGDQDGSAASPGLPSYKTSGQQTFFSYRTSTNTADVAFADGDRTRIAPQLYHVVGSLGLLGEYIVSEQEVANGKGSDTLETDAWNLSLCYVLTGEKPSLRGVTPLSPFDLTKGQWGAFELVARTGELHIDDDAFSGKYADPKKSAESAENWGVGVNWYLSKHARFNVNYEQTGFSGGAATGDRDDEKIIIARAQVSF